MVNASFWSQGEMGQVGGSAGGKIWYTLLIFSCKENRGENFMSDFGKSHDMEATINELVLLQSKGLQVEW